MDAPSASETSHFSLRDWIIIKSSHYYFLMGFSDDVKEIQRSHALACLNATDMTCRTVAASDHKLLEPRATDSVATFLLEHYRANFDADAIDATNDVLGNPDLLFWSFSSNDDIEKQLLLAHARLQQMSANPWPWLDELIEYFARYDVDPYRLSVPLNLNKEEWKLLRAKKLTSISIEVSLRGWLLQQLLTSIAQEVEGDIESVETLMSHADIADRRFPPSLFKTRELRYFLERYRLSLVFSQMTSLMRAKSQSADSAEKNEPLFKHSRDLVETES